MISIENVMLPNKPLSNWVAWYKNGKSKIYFDSYGVQPPNTDQLQSTGQVFYGHLCLYILKELSMDHKFQKV